MDTSTLGQVDWIIAHLRSALDLPDEHYVKWYMVPNTIGGAVLQGSLGTFELFFYPATVRPPAADEYSAVTLLDDLTVSVWAQSSARSDFDSAIRTANEKWKQRKKLEDYAVRRIIISAIIEHGGTEPVSVATTVANQIGGAVQAREKVYGIRDSFEAGKFDVTFSYELPECLSPQDISSRLKPLFCSISPESLVGNGFICINHDRSQYSDPRLSWAHLICRRF